MYPRTLATLLSTFTLASAVAIPQDASISNSSAPFLGADGQPNQADEAVFLLQCSRWQKGQSSPNGIKDLLLLNNNADSPDKNFWEDFPYHPDAKGSGHIEWTLGSQEKPITGTLNNRKFKVWDLCKKGCRDPAKDTDAITYRPPNGFADLGGANMRCYQIAQKLKKPLTAESWYDCTANYYCTRTLRKIRRTTFDLRDTTIELRYDDVVPGLGLGEGKVIPERVKKDIIKSYAHLQTVWDKQLATSGSSVEIPHTGYALKFFVDMDEQKGDATYDPNRITNITSILTDRLAAEIIKQGKFDRCQPGWAAKYSECFYKFKIPAQVDIKVQTSLQADDDWYTKTHVLVVAERIKGKDTTCQKEGAFSKAMAGALTVAGTLLSGGTSAIAQGLGAVFGVAGAIQCGEVPLWPGNN